MYSPEAAALRRCTGTTQDGKPCRAWALWDGGRQLCIRHSGRWRPHYGQSWWQYATRLKTRYRPCNCLAYEWPHRPGGGLCRWPDPPEYRCTTPAGTHSRPRRRASPELRALFRVADRL